MSRKNSITINIAIIAAIVVHVAALTLSSRAQSAGENAGKILIVIEGTSNIHDWTMRSDKGKCSVVLESNAENDITGLTFSIGASTIKSESRAMDKNAYKALKTDKFPEIYFKSSVINVKSNGNSSFHITTKGNLTISGVTKPVLLSAIAKVNPDHSVSYTGSYKLKMTDFNIEPPSIMMGAIRTGNEIVVRYHLGMQAVNDQTKN